MTKEKITYIKTNDIMLCVIERRADGLGYNIDQEAEYKEACQILTDIEKPFISNRAGYLTKSKRARLEWLINYLQMVLDYEEEKQGQFFLIGDMEEIG
jgi:hypothetical protein